jgi:3-isopropylmalate dehydrogenase
MMIRELTGGIYYGELRGRTEDGTKAYDTNVYSKEEISRVTRLAFEYAIKRKKKLTAVDKANILATSRLWRETIQDMEKEYPDVEVEYMFVDNAAMQIIQWPKRFDVIVTENMFGDILSDEASVITGSLGMLPSASIGIQTSVFEPIHGSYPQAAGKNIANPLATILSAAMMLDSLNLLSEAEMVRSAINASLENGVATEDIATEKSFTTSEVGDWLASYILES